MLEQKETQESTPFRTTALPPERIREILSSELLPLMQRIARGRGLGPDFDPAAALKASLDALAAELYESHENIISEWIAHAARADGEKAKADGRMRDAQADRGMLQREIGRLRGALETVKTRMESGPFPDYPSNDGRLGWAERIGQALEEQL